MIRDYNMLTKWHTPLLVAVSILLLIFCSTSLLREAIAAQETSQHKDIKAHWGYEPGNGPASWGKLNRDWLLCAEGNEQSPVDLTGARQEKFDEMTLAFPPANLKVVHQTHVIDAINNGHTIQINYDKGETFTIGDESYKLRQYHFQYVEPIQLSSDQIKVFRKIFHGNNRPTQPLNDRTLRYDVVGEIIK